MGFCGVSGWAGGEEAMRLSVPAHILTRMTDGVHKHEKYALIVCVLLTERVGRVFAHANMA